MAKAMGVTKKKPMIKNDDVEEKFVCPHCGDSKGRKAFYISSDPAVSIGVAFPCRECSEKIARNYNSRTGKYGEVTLASLKNALCYLDKPFIQKLYDLAHDSVHDETLTQPKTNIWAAYIVNVQKKQYKTMRWRDGDFEDTNVAVISSDSENRDVNPEVLTELEKNKRDVIKLIGYDPFEKEAVEDQPLLYAQ